MHWQRPRPTGRSRENRPFRRHLQRLLGLEGLPEANACAHIESSEQIRTKILMLIKISGAAILNQRQGHSQILHSSH
jgi:hypothetical protein